MTTNNKKQKQKKIVEPPMQLELTTKLNTPWQLYFHDDPQSWDKESYHEFGPVIETIESYIHIIHNLKSVVGINTANLYLFRTCSHPRWEDKTNANGIAWSMKTNLDNGLNNFIYICDKLVSENSLKPRNDFDMNGFVNGISLSYKEIHYIIKVMISNKKTNNVNFIAKDILNVNRHSDIIWQNIVL